ncbi:hypothetical protein OIU74_020233 [Salix koriyanagi]|uniref:Uncharacterized protein n=2 Tax=Salix TaxID=40685 RepID=A0A9Q0P5D4_9ROSI|nr:hypothetical protein OIU74_020233 [Salix koriyanagi]
MLNVNYSDLKLHISELAEFIAQELGINSSQVHMLNSMEKGNASYIEWDVVPSGSADCISNVTAISIIARVAEYHMQLPDTFGSYHLINWEIKAAAKRTWWQQHFLLVVLACVCAVAFIFGSLAFGIWFTWGHRQQALNPYKPVDAVVPEQELQPL